MDVTPILEAGEPAKPNIWYALSPDGHGPCQRVGHACVVFPRESPEKSEVDGNKDLGDTLIIIGGATPSGPFKDVYLLEMGKK